MTEEKLPPWWDKTKKQRSLQREKEAAKKHKGRVQPGSGAPWFAKGDVDAGMMLIEDKYTDAASYRMSLKVLDKIKKEAGPGRFPVLRVGIQDQNFIVLREEDCLF